MTAPFPRPALIATDAQIAALVRAAKRAVKGSRSDDEILADILDLLVEWHNANDPQDALSAAESAVDAATRLRDSADDALHEAIGDKEYYA